VVKHGCIAEVESNAANSVLIFCTQIHYSLNYSAMHSAVLRLHVVHPGTARDCPNFLSTPIISGTCKATNFKFCTHILSIDRNKSPLQISGKVTGCVVRTLETFQGTHLLGASRGLLCDSSAVLSL